MFMLHMNMEMKERRTYEDEGFGLMITPLGW